MTNQKLTKLTEKLSNIEYLVSQPHVSANLLGLKNKIIKQTVSLTGQDDFNDLSAEGKLKHKSAVKTKEIETFLKQARIEQAFLRKEVADMVAQTNEILLQQPPSPDPLTQQEFEKKLRDVQVAATVSDEPAALVKKLAKETTEPALAKRLLQEMPSLMSQILARGEGRRDDWSSELQDAYDTATHYSYNDEQREAARLKKAAQSYENYSIYSSVPVHKDFIQNELGYQWRKKFENPEAEGPGE